MKVGFYQFRPVFGQIQKNLNNVLNALKNVAADLVVLPELPFTGYYFKDRYETLALAEDPRESGTVTSLIKLCKTKDMYVVTGFAEKYKDKVFNSALLLGPQGIIHTYRKLHLFNEEKNWFDAGDTPLALQEVKGVKIGIMICFDWIFPEVMRSLSVQGAQVICHPSNLVLSYCQQAMLTRCLENNVFAVTANRFGADNRPHGKLRFTGKSQIVAPRGKLLHRAYSQKKALVVVAIDPVLAENKEITPLNHILEDRRPEFYFSFDKCIFIT